MNYNEVIFDIIKASHKEELIEPINDYEMLLNIRKNNFFNYDIVNYLLKKYEKEIREIDNIRSLACALNGKQTNTPITEMGVLDSLIDHLLSIICLRYIKDKSDENIKNGMILKKNKGLYESLCFVRDKG